MDCRRYTEIVTMRTDYIMSGFADGRMRDGTSCQLRRLGDGTWQAYLRGIEIGLPQATWEAAKTQLEHPMAGEGLWLRLS